MAGRGLLLQKGQTMPPRPGAISLALSAPPLCVAARSQAEYGPI
jgi:hypothetical protein